MTTSEPPASSTASANRVSAPSASALTPTSSSSACCATTSRSAASTSRSVRGGSTRCPEIPTTVMSPPQDRREKYLTQVATAVRCLLTRSSPGEDARVGVQRRLSTQVGVEHGGVRADLAGTHEVDQARHRLALVHRVDDHPLQAAAEPDR